MNKKNAIKFMTSMAEYFKNLPSNGEDQTFWANVQNQMNCIEVVRILQETPDRRLSTLHVEALAEIKATVDGHSNQPVRDIIYGLIDEINMLEV